MNESNEPARIPTRRRVMINGAALAGASLLNRGAAAQPARAAAPQTRAVDPDFHFKDDNPARHNVPGAGEPLAPGEPGKDYKPVIVPNGWTLPFTVVDGA